MRRWLRFAPAALLTLGWALTMLTPPSVKPLTGALVAIVFGAVAAAAGVALGFGVPRRLWAPGIALGVGLLGMAVGVVAHSEPLQSAMGVVGQHNGLLLWFSLPLWIYAGVATGTGRPMRAALWSMAAFGGVAAVFALLDAGHLFEVGARYSPEVAGLLESSISLGQVLLLTMGATAALVFAEKAITLRGTAVVLLLLEFAALELSGARGAQVTFVVALALLGVWHVWPRMGAGLRRAWQVGLAVVAAAGTAVLGYAAVVGPTSGWTATLDKLLTNRVIIWHSAMAHVPERLLLGAGTDRFSAVITWQLAAGGGVPYTTTTSPHNVVLDWLLAGGLLGALGMLAAVALLARAVLAAPHVRHLASRALAVGVAAWALSLLLSWVDPLSLAVAGLALGLLLADGRSASGEEPPARGLLGAASWTAIALLVLIAVGASVVGANLFALERSWAAANSSGQSQSGTDLARWQAWHDPAFGSLALQSAQASGNADLIRQVAGEVLATVPWNAETDISCAVAAAYLARQAPPASPTLAACLAAGKSADSASGIWDAIAKVVSGK